VAGTAPGELGELAATFDSMGVLYVAFGTEVRVFPPSAYEQEFLEDVKPAYVLEFSDIPWLLLTSANDILVVSTLTYFYAFPPDVREPAWTSNYIRNISALTLDQGDDLVFLSLDPIECGVYNLQWPKAKLLAKTAASQG
jgi:hypothetical protein